MEQERLPGKERIPFLNSAGRYLVTYPVIVHKESRSMEGMMILICEFEVIRCNSEGLGVEPRKRYCTFNKYWDEDEEFFEMNPLSHYATVVAMGHLEQLRSMKELKEVELEVQERLTKNRFPYYYYQWRRPSSG